MLLTSGLLGRNRTSPAGNDDLGCRGFHFAGENRPDACLLESGYCLIFDIDRFEALLGDAKRHRSSFVIAAPDRERATGADLLQQAGADELIDNLSGRFALDIRRQFNAAIIALRSRDRMMSCVSVSLDIGILRCVGAASLPPPPQPHLGHAAGGAGSRGATRARNVHTTALFAAECQSFLDNVIAGSRQTG
jgi:hypothetical protein